MSKLIMFFCAWLLLSSITVAQEIDRSKILTAKMLYGRVEQLINSGDQNIYLPTLNKNIQLNLPQLPQRDESSPETIFLGSNIDTYPDFLNGVWGGSITKVYFYDTPKYMEDNLALVQMEAKAMPDSISGCINFVFSNKSGKLLLEPPLARFMIPFIDTQYGIKAKSLLDHGHPLLFVIAKEDGSCVEKKKLTLNNINEILAPMSMGFNNVSKQNKHIDLMGQKVKQILCRNELRKLNDNVFEQDLITKIVSCKNKQEISTFKEVAIRLDNSLANDKINFTLISVIYDENGMFLAKVIYNGEVQRGIKTDNEVLKSGYAESKFGFF